MLTIADLEQLQTEYPEWQMELVEGNIVIMGPSDYESEEIGGRFYSMSIKLLRLLTRW